MGEKWPKTGHIPPHFLFEADIWLPGIYFHLCLDHRPEITVLGHTAFCRITRDFLADGIMPARVVAQPRVVVPAEAIAPTQVVLQELFVNGALAVLVRPRTNNPSTRDAGVCLLS